VAFWTVLALVCAAGVVLAIVREEDPPPPSCPPTRQCGGPPPLIPSAALRTWESTGLGFQFEYSPALFRIEEEGDDSVRLRVRASRTDDVDAEVWVTGARVRDASAVQLLRERRDDLEVSVLGLTDDDDPSTIVVAPALGTVQALGGSYRGTVDTPQGPTVPAVVLVIAATDGELSAVLSFAVSGTTKTSEIRRLRAYLDTIVASFEWPASDRTTSAP
jgi:hypothetical protein